MTEERTQAPPDADPTQGNDTISPLPGEAGIPSVARPRTVTLPWRTLGAAALGVMGLTAVGSHWLGRIGTDKHSEDAESKRIGDRPAAASTEPRRLDMSNATPASGTASSGTATVRIPALVPTAEELAADPIGVRRSTPSTPTVAPAPSASPIKAQPPEDAPAVLISARPDPGATAKPQAAVVAPDDTRGDPLDRTRRNLDAYQQQLQGLLSGLTQATSAATGTTPPGGGPASAMGSGSTSATTSAATGTAPAGLFGGQLPASTTPRVAARRLGDRSLILPKGTTFTCALKTKVISANSGLVGCQVQRNVYSDDGRVLLIERGSHVDGEYRITSVRPGTVRIPVLWTRIRTPNGVVVDIDSPGTGPLGESGIDGYVDNRWGERIGAALLLSLIDDSVSLLIQRESNGQQGSTVLLPSTTTNTSKLAEKVLDSTINIPPLIYQNQGGIVGIYVARDVDFSSVYELRPSTP